MTAPSSLAALSKSGLFSKSCIDLIKGIRAHPRDESKYIAECVAEIREELKSTLPGVKQQAVLKLAYLHQYGHDVSWASFHFVDVMSFPRFRAKRIGFLAASQTFDDETDVALLTTNLFRKSFASPNPQETGLAVAALAKLATPELARDLLSEVTALLASSRPLLRKKALLCCYRLLARFPEALPAVFPRLRERLDDADPGVVTAAVNVLVELATHNPKGYLGLAPALYRVLASGATSNWTLIKVVKLMRALVPHEPRLGRKLSAPLARLIDTTGAKSLQYECLLTVASVMHEDAELLALAARKLSEFVAADDANLKFLGLVALAALQAADAALVDDGCREAVLRCLDDDDGNVRSQAITLLGGMVTRANLTEVVAQLMARLAAAEDSYRGEIVAAIVAACRADSFANVSSFKWLVGVLLQLAAAPPTDHDGRQAAQAEAEHTTHAPSTASRAARPPPALWQCASVAPRRTRVRATPCRRLRPRAPRS